MRRISSTVVENALRTWLIKYHISVLSKLQPVFTFPHMDNDVTSIHSQARLETTLGQKGMWPHLSNSSSQLQTYKGLPNWQKNSIKFERMYETIGFKTGKSQTLCLFSDFSIYPSPIFAGTCCRQDSSNPFLINTSPNLLVILLIVHKQAI